VTDLIKKSETGIPELKLSLLNELRNCNIYTSSGVMVCITCFMRHQDFQFPSLKLDNGQTAPVIEIDAKATLADANLKLTPKELTKINQLLKKEFGLELNKVKRGEANFLLESLGTSAIYGKSAKTSPTIKDRSSKPSICCGYNIPPSEVWWPLNLERVNKD
jgi:hypothetical protein